MARIEHETGRFQHRHAKQRLFILTRKNERPSSRFSHDLNNAKTNWQFLP